LTRVPSGATRARRALQTTPVAPTGAAFPLKTGALFLIGISVRDRERKWLLRGTFQGRRAREQEYQAARARRGKQQPDTVDATSAPPAPS
jgi:hypothetical protein